MALSTLYQQHRGQLSLEYLIVLGIALVVLLPFIQYTFSNLNVQLALERTSDCAVNAASTLETVNNLAPGSWYTEDSAFNIQISNKVVYCEKGTIFESSHSTYVTVAGAMMYSGNVHPGKVAYKNDDTNNGANNQALVFNVPYIQQLVPSVVSQGVINWVTVTGTDFTPTSVMYMDGKVRATLYLSSTQISFQPREQHEPPLEDGDHPVYVTQYKIRSNRVTLKVTEPQSKDNK